MRIGRGKSDRRVVGPGSGPPFSPSVRLFSCLERSLHVVTKDMSTDAMEFR